jgi:hypothetical protein
MPPNGERIAHLEAEAAAAHLTDLGRGNIVIDIAGVPDDMSDRIRVSEDAGDRPSDLSERVTRLEVWRQADRERMMAFETEVRSGLMDLRSRSDAIFTRLNDIVQAQAMQVGSKQTMGSVTEWARVLIGSTLGGSIGFIAAHMFR